MKVAKLICVGVDIRETGQSNKFYNMAENSDGQTFTVEYGRVGLTKATQTYPMSKWNSKFNEKVKHGYNDVTDLSEVVSVNIGKKVNSPGDDILNLLQGFAKSSISKEYLQSSDKITQKQVDNTQSLLDSLALTLKDSSIKGEDVDKILLEIYKTIPRKMDNVRSHLINKKDFLDSQNVDWTKSKIGTEQNLLDQMAGQVLLKESESIDRSLCDILDVSISIVTDQTVIDKIKLMMADNSKRIVRIFEVTNNKTKKKLDSFRSTIITSNTQELFHGSRNENWFNIVQSGLLIKPAGAFHTGSMYGNANYFASKAQKSIGYTSIKGSYWVKGSANTAFLSVYEIELSRTLEVKKHSSECYSYDKQKMNAKGYDSVWAKGGADLINDEFMAYDPAQCTIKYLIEFN